MLYNFIAFNRVKPMKNIDQEVKTYSLIIVYSMKNTISESKQIDKVKRVNNRFILSKLNYLI